MKLFFLLFFWVPFLFSCVFLGGIAGNSTNESIDHLHASLDDGIEKRWVGNCFVQLFWSTVLLKCFVSASVGYTRIQHLTFCCFCFLLLVFLSFSGMNGELNMSPGMEELQEALSINQVPGRNIFHQTR